MLIPHSPEKWHTINLFFLVKDRNWERVMTKLIYSGGKPSTVLENSLPACVKGKAFLVRGETAASWRTAFCICDKLYHKMIVGTPNLAKMLNDSPVNRPNPPSFSLWRWVYTQALNNVWSPRFLSRWEKRLRNTRLPGMISRSKQPPGSEVKWSFWYGVYAFLE